jgi:starch-binding outer membrane protein SusE/F
MKTVLTKFLAISSIALLMLASCKKDGAIVTSNGGKPGALSANTTTPVLDKTKLNDPTMIINLSISKANYGFSAAVTSTLQIDAVGDNWANPITFTLGATVLSQGFNTADFNALLLKLNLVGGVTSQVNVRVVQSVSAQVAPIYSNVLSLTVTPFNLASFEFVPGAYQGWGPGSADSLLSATSNGVFTGVISFKGATDFSFKVTSDKKGTTWFGNLGGVVSSSGSAGNFVFINKATVDPAVNIMSDQIVIDEVKNTITLTPTLWSIVGDASPGGWPNPSGSQSDTDMKFNNGTQTWTAVVHLGAGAIKFRLNHDWGVNLGGSGGTLSVNGANIAIATAGTYTVTLDVAHNTYTVQ